jgi:hypothetical protein
MCISNIQDPEKTIFEAHQKFLMDQRSLQWHLKDATEKLESVE